jgi:aromatic-amino-acid transaminase
MPYLLTEPFMFESLAVPPPDRILSLIPLFRADARPEKIDLGVGVYRDASGRTPIMRAVAEAERRLLASETTKAYVGPAGDAAFCDLMTEVVFGADAPRDRLRAIQTPGGAAALTLLAGVTALARPGATVHVPEPTWVNHVAILNDFGLKLAFYPYLDAERGVADVPRLLAHLQQAAPSDVVLLHGACHNPSGADLSLDDWRAVAEIVAARRLVPFVDLAYQGFGDGLDEDAFGVRLLAAAVPTLIVAASCSKNFGIYRERTGLAFVLAPTPAIAEAVKAQMVVRARVGYSMPPDHGSAIVRTVLSDPALRSDWRTELEEMRAGVADLRHALADTFQRLRNDDRFGFLRQAKGMFSLLGTSVAQAARLREDHAIYIVEDGRINIAGLRLDQVETFCRAVIDVGR